MGVHNRDYMRDRPLPFSAATSTPVTWWILGINLVIWILAAGSYRSGDAFGVFVYEHFVLMPDRVVGHAEVWRPFTAFWLHDAAGFGHLFLNMLLLGFLGRPVEGRLGSRRYLLLYLAAGLASTLFLVVFHLVAPRPIVVLGASGAVYGVLTWLATVEPRRVVLLFGILPMQLWLLVGVLILGSEVLSLADARRPMEPALGHLAGAACGFVFARRGNPFAGLVGRRARPSARKQPPPNRTGAPDDVRARVDALLKKIHDDGIETLTEAEKQFLQEASQRYR